jgi:large subunit ribosomal protein L15
MKLDELRPAPGASHRRKIVGRGPASGQGKTSGKGNKGHNARSGGGKGGGFEGGQMPLYRRLPKRGFFPYGGKTEYAVVNLKALGGFAANAVVDPTALAEAGLIKGRDRARVKILGAGDVAHGLTVKAHAVSGSARAKIEAKGGRVEVLGARVKTS